MKFSTAFATLAAIVSGAAAQLTILSPGGPDLWWVDGEVNDVTWTCNSSPYQNFTVLLGSSNTSILTSNYAFVAEQPNYQCSVEIYSTQLTKFPPADGYTIIFANILNSSDIYATSQPFEIKAEGAQYPASSATPTGTATATSSAASASGSSSSGSSTQSNGAGALAVPMGGLAMVGAVLGLAMA
ncbi:uncharacterized protein C8Q71DRAFT_783088 [Rhodofomes roseus]|uniref:Uncharacterized protein n=1 Tax=Rhodofomes roseus TaxID=34475 RepID=A0A4Y9Z4Q3_9APHY|nr:uncharacterized protein C8Q71DRAFT_783088 [Rhodofomes roseus]KAH9831172.1 hypothetical protein C8Q71DRAFT_783088 [Rhodofomes roseus]TFY69836.1 hypothetical protein EVJ58_g203 [Rhodofomes roseus]